MARMNRFRRRRPRIRWAWTGISATAMVDHTGLTAFSIVEPVTFSTVADVTIERVLIDFSITYANVEESTPVAGDAILGSMVLATVPTGSDEVPITSGLPRPLSGDIDDTQKRPMWTKWFYFPPLPATLQSIHCIGTMTAWSQQESLSQSNITRNLEGVFNNNAPIDIGVRRKLGGDQALVLAFDVSTYDSANHAVDVNLYARALLRIGRK